MLNYRYSRWDGTQTWADLSSNDLMDVLSDELIDHGDLARALRRLFQQGFRMPSGQQLQGLRDLLQQLRDQRQQTLDKYDLSSVYDEIRERLDKVIETERQGIQQRLEEMPQGATQDSGDGGDDQLREMLQEIAQRKLSTIDSLPKDVGGAIKELTEYEFMDAQAREQFQELLEMLKQRALESYFRDVVQQLQGLTPQDMAGMNQMLSDLNQMLEQQRMGGQPDFEGFMQRYGDLFGPDRPDSLEELVEELQRRIAQAQSLMDSLPSELRNELQELMQQMLQDQGLRQQMTQLAMNLESLYPSRNLRNDYPFRGEDPVSWNEALKLMEQLQGLDELEGQLKRARMWSGLEDVDAEKLRELLGEEAHDTLEQMKQVTEILEEEGYIQRRGSTFELTPKGIRRIGQKALTDIFGILKQDRFGKHKVRDAGPGVDRGDDTKGYEFGDPFLLHLERTLMNAIRRQGPGRHVRLAANDFEVYKTELLTESATVLLLDMSWSMPLRGNFLAAKKVVLALDALIRTQFPRDNLYIVGFSDYARELKKEQLPNLSWNEFVYGTNMQHGLMLARQLLSRHKNGTRQIIMITDGEPTAHLEDGRAFFAYPPTFRTIQETLKEVKRCTRERIIINIFMLESRRYLRAFVDRITRINRGRAFFTTAENLGEYILVDYLSKKRSRITA